MWESITSMVNGGNGIYVLILIAILLLIAVITSKKGLLSVRTSHISLGGALIERDVIRHQIEEAYICSFDLCRKLGLDEGSYLTKYTGERIYDKVVEWIMFNHISNASMYVSSKGTAILNLVRNVADCTDECTERIVADWTKHTVERLMELREYYTTHRR